MVIFYAGYNEKEVGKQALAAQRLFTKNSRLPETEPVVSEKEPWTV